MKLEELIDRSQEIEQLDRAGDHEAAHSREYTLHRDVLCAIADENCEGASPATFAAVALNANKEGYPR